MVQILEYSGTEEAEDAKLLGNAAFQRKEYDVAIKQYTKAIQIQGEGALHIFYSNRAACWIALKATCLTPCLPFASITGPAALTLHVPSGVGKRP